jgi:hypothetical protein
MSSQRARERRRRLYRPDELRVLLVGESPPSGPAFFYDADSALYRATRDAFTAVYPSLATVESLPAFRRLGCYLEDLSHAPIDKLLTPERREARRAAIPRLARRLDGLAPQVVIIVVKSIRSDVIRALTKAGLDGVAVEAKPFSGQWRRTRYIDELTRLVRSWRRRGGLLPLTGPGDAAIRR